MKVGDLVKLKRPTTRCFNKVFLITEWLNDWIKVLGHDGWQSAADYEVVNESR